MKYLENKNTASFSVAEGIWKGLEGGDFKQTIQTETPLKFH